jgi:hypothetical protein
MVFGCHASDDALRDGLEQTVTCHTRTMGPVYFDHSRASFPLTSKHIGVVRLAWRVYEHPN